MVAYRARVVDEWQPYATRVLHPTSSPRGTDIDYLTTICEVDLPTIDPARPHPRLALRVIQVLDRNIGMSCVVTRVAQDASTDDSDARWNPFYVCASPPGTFDEITTWECSCGSSNRLVVPPPPEPQRHDTRRDR